MNTLDPPQPPTRVHGHSPPCKPSHWKTFRHVVRIALLVSAKLIPPSAAVAARGMTVPSILHHQWWHQGLLALGRTSSACEEGDHVAQSTRVTRNNGALRASPYVPNLHNTSKAIPIRGLAHTPRKLVCVKTSLLSGAGNGLFAAKEICTYATNIKSRAHQIAFKICPYTGDPPSGQHSEYVITVGNVSVDAFRLNSCWPRFINDALNVELDNVTAILIDGVIWIVPLPGVEILQHQELYLAYDWEFWYRKWLTCDLQLRERILRRYSVASSTPHLSASPTSDELAELQRVSDFWYKHWSWWSHDMRRQIIRHFKLANYEAYNLDAETIPCELEQDSESDADLEADVEHQLAEQPELSEAEHRRHGPTQAPVDPAPVPLPAPRMLGPATSPTTNLLPQSNIDQADRPVIAPAPRLRIDLNPQRPQPANHPPLKVWAAESRSE